MLTISARFKGAPGDQVEVRDVITTDATTEIEFISQLSEAIVSLIAKHLDSGETLRSTLEKDGTPDEKAGLGYALGLAEHDIRHLLQNAFEITCKLRGYKADRVNEKRVIWCGESFPARGAAFVSVKNGSGLADQADIISKSKMVP